MFFSFFSANGFSLDQEHCVLLYSLVLDGHFLGELLHDKFRLGFASVSNIQPELSEQLVLSGISLMT